MDNITVSILMPVFNESLYIKECLDSIIIQEEQHWELIAVDDFSTDDSWSILEAYAVREPRIKILKNTRKGIIPALQNAFKISNGVFITRMDADDIMTKDRLSAMLDVLKNNAQSSVAVGHVEYFSKAGISNGYFKYQNWLNKLTTASNNFDDIYKECVIPSPCWMTSRNNFIRCGGFESEIYPEDYDLAFRFYSFKSKIIGIPKILHKWRDYPSRSSRVDPNYNDNRFLNLKLHYFLKQDWKGKKIVIWGAGKKGKFIARYLNKTEIPFKWICNNAQKIGKQIYAVTMEDSTLFTPDSETQFILAVASNDSRGAIESKMKSFELKRNQDFYWFC